MEHTDPRHDDESAFGARIHAVLSPASPIQSEEFLFGRDEQLERIRRCLMAPGRQVFIYGERGVGKSSLANAAAAAWQSSDKPPLQVSCGRSDTFSSVVGSLIRATQTEIDGTITTRKEAKVSAKLLDVGGQIEITKPQARDPADIEGAAYRLDAAFSAYSSKTIAVIDEFDLIVDANERNRFAELVKALGDRKSSVKLIFTGVAAVLDELLESHGSAQRQFETIELERLPYQARIDVVKAALNYFFVFADESVTYRIASVSNGFPYYVHLLTEHLLWAWYGDKQSHDISLPHLHKAFAGATGAVHAGLRQPYDKATKGRDQAAFVLWAAADAFDLERTTDAIWLSYSQICETLEVPALDRAKFTGQLRKLREPSHACILEQTPERKLHRFQESMVRGYVRMAAASRGIELDDQQFDPPPQALVHAPRFSKRKRWIDTSRFIPNMSRDKR
ncbi:AAA ATPase domain-containing protein [Luteibacter sp. UNCMF331Sha3.1]|uniref:AAA family ATPase n=1 Tax=Luteibacter sp. UNCMF331Sha3.1 TaxID=1502760 RepID=UPI0008AE6495|nr:ATP-binding protein [Luteibacter sp. UNCMF331Sha3.1]SEM54213.1 AAA ATPase domain-containing protein [Luteibacter sp. UNCMF331Sha3.1]